MRKNHAFLCAASMLAAGACLGAAPAQAALTVQTTDFLSGYSNYNGFEGLGATANYPSNTPYTEDGITVTYVGSANIWTYSQAAEGQYSWYENGGGTGYTSITFGGPIDAVEFQAGSGFGSSSVQLVYNVLLGGVSIGTGSIDGLSSYTGFKFYGFSGALFDEVQLQGRAGSGNVFDPSAFEAGAYDAINFGGLALGTPEPAAWVMMIAGFGLVGASMRRRNVNVAYA